MIAFRLRQFAALIVLACWPVCHAAAQSESGEKSTAATQTADDSAKQPTTSKPTTPAKRKASKKTAGKAGKTVAPPVGPEYERFLEFLSRKDPDFSVNSVELAGDAKGDRAVLTATLLVQVLRDDKWLRVPLFLNEAVIRKTDHKFLGDRMGGKLANATGGRAAYADSTREAGYRWWFRGQGYHRLTLTIVVPVVRTVAQRRMRLTLPPLVAASTLALKVPVAGLEKSQVSLLPEGPDLRVRNAGSTGSEIEITGIGPQLDVKWRSVTVKPSSRPLLRSESAMLVNVTEDTVVLTVLQKIGTFSGKFDEVRVTLPAGFRPLNVEGDFVESHTSPDNKNRCLVRFKESRSEPTEIKWTLEKKFNTRSGRLTVEGFDVENAQSQTGDVALLRVPGLRIAKLDEGNRNVSRIRVANFGAADLIRDHTVSAAYHFFKQPFRLNLEAAPLKSHVSVDPSITLAFSKDQVTLDVTFRANVSEDGGLIDRLDVIWPDWKEAGWKLQPLAASRDIERRTQGGRGKQPVLSHRLYRRRNGEIVIRLTATRSLPKEGIASITLPRMEADATRPTELSVEREPNIEVLISQSGGVLRPELAGTKKPPANRSNYRLASSVAPLSVEVATHPRVVEVSSTVTLIPTNAGVRVRQQIAYDVRYEPLKTVAVRIPTEFAAAARFVDSTDRPLETRTSGGAAAEPKFEVLELPTLPTSYGRHTFAVEYYVAFRPNLSLGETLDVELPVVQLTAAQKSRVRLQLDANSRMTVAIDDPAWRPLMQGRTPRWTTDGAPGRVVVAVTDPAIPGSRQFVISRALLRAVVAPDGHVRYRAQYRLSQGNGEFVFFLPRSIRVEGVWIGKQRLETPLEGQLLERRVAYRVPVEKRGALITVDYRNNGAAALGWLSRRTLLAPTFPDSVSVGESAWRVVLPSGNHVSSHGAGAFAAYDWRFDGRVYVREPSEPFYRADAWIAAGDGPDWSEPTDAYVYVFRQFGPATELSVGTMSTSAIILFGAGVTWLIGLMLVRFSAARSVYTFLTMALLASIAGLWYSRELELLAQPAAFGALLAAGCVSVERLLKRNARTPTVPTANPTEFILNSRAAASSTGHRSIVIGSEEVTNHNVPAAAEPASSEMRSLG